MKSVLFVSMLAMSLNAFAGAVVSGNSGDEIKNSRGVNTITITVNGNPIEFTPENLELIKAIAQRGSFVGCPPEDKCTVKVFDTGSTAGANFPE